MYGAEREGLQGRAKPRPLLLGSTGKQQRIPEATGKSRICFTKTPQWSTSQVALQVGGGGSGHQGPSVERKNLSSSRLSDFIIHLIEWENPEQLSPGCTNWVGLQLAALKVKDIFHYSKCSHRRITSHTWSLALQIGADSPVVPQPESWEPCVIMGLPLWAHQPSSCSGSFPRG